MNKRIKQHKRARKEISASISLNIFSYAYRFILQFVIKNSSQQLAKYTIINNGEWESAKYLLNFDYS